MKFKSFIKRGIKAVVYNHVPEFMLIVTAFSLSSSTLINFIWVRYALFILVGTIYFILLDYLFSDVLGSSLHSAELSDGHFVLGLLVLAIILNFILSFIKRACYD